MNDFRAREKERQIALRGTGLFPGSGRRPGMIGGKQRNYYLPSGLWRENLDPEVRGRALFYFDRHRIAWSDHIASLLSSQACCLNHLLPFVARPDALARLLEPVLGPDLEMLPIPDDGLHGEPWFVAFEYFGPTGSDFLGEGYGKPLIRGAGSTSVDAVVRYRRAGKVEVALIEWKYVEWYDDHPSEWQIDRRERRLRPLVDRNGGLFRSDRTVRFRRLLVQPLYQLLRQQLLAREMERVRVLDADIVRVLHLAPRENDVFAGVSGRRGDQTTTRAWSAVLACPDRFITAAIEDVFGPAAHPDAAALLARARARYAFTGDRRARVR